MGTPAGVPGPDKAGEVVKKGTSAGVPSGKEI